MREILITSDKAKECRCLTAPCATFKLQELEGGVFCANGPHQKMAGREEHNGCECQGCPIRAEGGFGPVLWCMDISDKTPEANQGEPVNITVNSVAAHSTQAYQARE